MLTSANVGMSYCTRSGHGLVKDHEGSTSGILLRWIYWVRIRDGYPGRLSFWAFTSSTADVYTMICMVVSFFGAPSEK